MYLIHRKNTIYWKITIVIVEHYMKIVHRLNKGINNGYNLKYNLKYKYWI